MPLVHPGRARMSVCAACGAVHDLRTGGNGVVGRASREMHRPEGLLEVGRSGRLRERVAQVVGRVRYANLDGAQLKMWDEWVLITSDARYLHVREEAGAYRLLLPFDPERPVPPAARDRAEVDQRVPFEGRVAKVAQRFRAKVVHMEGELAWRVAVGDTIEVMELQTLDGVVALVFGFDGETYFTVDELEDRAMWSIFGYVDILRAWDALVRARERAEGLARGFVTAAAVLLGGSLLGSLLMLGVVVAHQPLDDGWARFDFLSRDPPGEQALGTVPMYPGLGFYTLSGECGLDVTSVGLEVVAYRPSDGAPMTLVRCTQRGVIAEVRDVEVSFRVPEGGAWRLAAIHRQRPGTTGKAHVSWRLVWHFGSAWWPLMALLGMTTLGLLGLVAWPISLRLGLRPFELQYDDRRAELALELRRRHAAAPRRDRESEDEP